MNIEIANNHYAMTQKNNSLAHVSQSSIGRDTGGRQNVALDTAVIASISKEGTQKFFESLSQGREYSKLDLSNFTKETRALLIENMPKREEIWIQTSIPSSEVIRKSVLFATDTIERCVFDALEDKVGKDTAYQFSQLFSDMIFNGEGKSTEERVADRKSAVSLAESLVQTHMSDSDDAKEFLEMINSFVEKGEMKDKGYMVFNSLKGFKPDNPEDAKYFGYVLDDQGYIQAFKPHKTNPVYDYAAKHYGYTLDERGINQELMDDTEKFSSICKSFFDDAQKGSVKWLEALEACKERDDGFYSNVKNVQDTIEEAKKTTSGFDFDDKSFAIISNALSSMKYVQTVSWRELSNLLQ